MKKTLKTLTPLRIGLLCAVNGLVIGLIAERVRIAYLNHQMDKIIRKYSQSDWSIDFVEAQWELLVPLLCVVVFATVGYLICRYFIDRPRTLLMTWFVMGVVAIWAGYFMSTLSPNVYSLIWLLFFALISYLVYNLWRRSVHSIMSLWLVMGVSAVFVFAVCVQLVGLLFYWPELRNPLAWLLFLGAVIVVNAIYGATMQLFVKQALTKSV